MRKLILILSALLAGVALYGQDVTGGVKGTVISRNDRQPV